MSVGCLLLLLLQQIAVYIIAAMLCCFASRQPAMSSAAAVQCSAGLLVARLMCHVLACPPLCRRAAAAAVQRSDRCFGLRLTCHVFSSSLRSAGAQLSEVLAAVTEGLKEQCSPFLEHTLSQVSGPSA